MKAAGIGCLRLVVLSTAVGSNAEGGEDCNRVEFAAGDDPIFSGELQGRHEIGKQAPRQVGLVSEVVNESGKSTMAEPRRLDKEGSGMLHDVSVTQVSGPIYFGLRDQGVLRKNRIPPELRASLDVPFTADEVQKIEARGAGVALRGVVEGLA
ncbi:hypothetical protein Q3G72_006835 [Acer saccharum]|nr:hypothetical protein Q3G72_006835 [Acer saccharum]